MNEPGSSNHRQMAGFVLCRVVVPLWVLTGAIFKLVERTPELLPEKTVLAIGKALPVDIFFYLATLIAVEFVAAALMLFVARLARPVAIFVLGVFCAVLIGEMLRGNVTECGCMGGWSPPPYVMLAIDGLLLAGVIVLGPGKAPAGRPARWPLGSAALVAVAGIAASYAFAIPPAPPPAEDGNGDGDDGNGANGETSIPGDPTVNPSPERPRDGKGNVVGYWMTPPDVAEWVGKPWLEVPLFRFMKKWPRDMDAPVRYIVFYSRTCDHCQEMFERDLTDPALGALTAGVRVPDSETALDNGTPWFMPDTEVELEGLQLPLGYGWYMTTPVTLRIENGIVKCAEEGGHEGCMGG